ncbi:MAG: FAD-binding oxidoreductase, partial [Chitinophagales bacterium]|nr:FAD-binding oxidoreductase [Chitinophagales bacterium]MDW8273793.1 FAD-binding oxidoreductase [Chitinophagales bacterium]
MSKFHKLKVASVNRETKDCVSVVFEIPESLKSLYQYIPGQYITLKLHINGEQVNRSYSFCSSPYMNEPPAIAVKEVPGGKGSVFINQNVKAGDELEVMVPMGNFHTPLHRENSKHYVLFGGGSGITPLMSILKSVLIAEPSSKVTLFYGNRDEESIIFKDRLNLLLNEYPDRLKVVHVLDNPSSFTPYHGYIVKEMALRLLRENTNMNFTNAEFFICGPTPM